MKALFVDDTDIVDVQVVLEKLGAELRQCGQQIFLAGIQYWEYVFATENALITINKPTQQLLCVITRCNSKKLGWVTEFFKHLQQQQPI